MAWEENSRICLHMQLIAILSRIGVYILQCARYADFLKGRTTLESIIVNAVESRQTDFLKGRTICKSITSDIFQRRRELYVFQFIATIKAAVTYRFQSIWKNYIVKFGTAREYIISWLSVLYALNGRKVAMWILYGNEMAKI